MPTRNRLRKVILTDETFRTLITESTTIEEYTEKIQRHPTYGPMFEPPTWEVIFRLFSLPEVPQHPVVLRRPKSDRYAADTYRSGYSAVRSVTEEDVSFSTRSRLSQAHFVPLPDYPMDDEQEQVPKTRHWAHTLPDPKPYDSYSPEHGSTLPAFATTRRFPSLRSDRYSPTQQSYVFGHRRLENPYSTGDSPPSSRRRLFDYDIRPYSPDLDALSLEPSQSYLAYSGSMRRHKANQRNLEEREEIKSTTETKVYDWKRYS